VQKDGHSSFAWVIANGVTPVWRGMGLAPGPEEHMYSGRAEAFGLLAATLYLKYYLSCYTHEVPATTIPTYCDNLGVINMLTDMQNDTIQRPNDTMADDRDLYLTIADTAQQCSPIQFHYLHVKGHQDSKPDHILTTEEQHNVECDGFAKQFLLDTTTISTTLDTPEFPAAQPHLKIQGKVICCRFLPAIHQAAAQPEYWDYLCKRFNWTYTDANTVQWRTLSAALQLFPSNDQRWLVLFVHQKLPLRTSKFHPHMGSTLCPSCQKYNETSQHFLECNHAEHHHLFEQLWQNLTAIANKYSLHPCILTSFWLGLLTICNATPYPDIAVELPRVLCKTIMAQTCLGWVQLYYGRVAKQWEQAVDSLHPRLPVTGRQVMTYMIQAIWTFTLATWSTRN